MTDAELSEVTRNIDSFVISACGVREMYSKLNTLRSNGDASWQLLRSPMWLDGKVVAVVVRPAKDFDYAEP